MKKLSVFLISLYQLFVSPLVHALVGGSVSCRYQPTCSEYTKQMISQQGALKGIGLGLKRLSTCHPFGGH